MKRVSIIFHNCNFLKLTFYYNGQIQINHDKKGFLWKWSAEAIYNDLYVINYEQIRTARHSNDNSGFGSCSFSRSHSDGSVSPGGCEMSRSR